MIHNELILLLIYVIGVACLAFVDGLWSYCEEGNSRWLYRGFEWLREEWTVFFCGRRD